MTKQFGAEPWMKKARIFTYTRISDRQQTQGQTLKRQKALVDKQLKALGLSPSKKGDWYSEIASGTKSDRTQWLALRAEAMRAAENGKRAFIVVNEPSRWSRDTDDAVEAWAPLKRMGIPILAVSENIQTGTVEERRPDESLFFLMKTGFGAHESDVKRVKGKAGVTRQREEGQFPGKGKSLFPFAAVDPLDVLIEYWDVLGTRGGPTLVKEKVEVISMPNGMKASAVNRYRDDEELRLKNLSPAQYEQWRKFRSRIRDILREAEYDPWATKGNRGGSRDWKMNALLNMTGLYLKEPWKYDMPTSEDVERFQDVEYLSDKDKKRRGKR